MLEHFATAKNVITTPFIKESLVWLLGAGLTFVLSRSPVGRRLWYQLKTLLPRPDDEAMRQAWGELMRDIGDDRITADSRLYGFRNNGMPPLRPAWSDDGQGLQALPGVEWIRDPAVQQTAVAQRPAINKTHAFAVGAGFKGGDSSGVVYVPTNYAMVLAGRAHGHKPPIISANALVFCAPTQRLLLMIRSTDVNTYPGALHFLGGNFEPALNTERFDEVDKESPLRRTALREVEEESGLKIAPPEKGYVLVGEERSTGFIQFTYAALYISEAQMAQSDASEEGSLLAVSFSELQDYIASGTLRQAGQFYENIKMTPSLALCLLAWLRLGAPNQDGRTPVKKEALALYEKIKYDIRKRL